jgi:tellurite resistance protein TerC
MTKIDENKENLLGEKYMIYFPFIEYWPLYLGFIVFVLFMLGLDLGVFHKKVHEVSVKEASIWTVVWIGLALLFNVVFYYYTLQKFENPELAKTLSLEFLTGFLIEKSLAIDNIFIFAIVFSYFKIPKIYQHRVLFWGILGALFFRGIFIALGSVLMEYKAVVIFFGVFLVITGVKMFFKSSEEEDLETNFMIKLLKKFFKILLIFS